MARIRVTKEFHFEMAHALWNYDGPCKNIHGHSYRLFVTIIGEPIGSLKEPKLGMVLDFKDLKLLIKEPVVDYLDHSLALFKKAGGETVSAVRDIYEKVYVFDFQPTCENLVEYISKKIQSLLPDKIELHSVKLYETASSFAEWYSDDNR